jgi:hypothetical protein
MTAPIPYDGFSKRYDTKTNRAFWNAHMTTDLEHEARELMHARPELALEIARQVNARSVQHGLTKRQTELLGYIRFHISTHGISPSYEEMMAAVGLASKSSVHNIVRQLERRGHISRIEGANRSMAMTTGNAFA